MANIFFIDVNKVENIVTKTICYEIKIWDSYNNSSFSIEEEEIPDNDLDALQHCIEIGSDMSQNVCDIVDAILEYKKGVNINSTFYDWDEIQHLFDIEEEE